MSTGKRASVVGGYQPKERSRHSSLRVGDNLYLWAGHQSGLPSVHSNKKKKLLTSTIEVFHLPTGKWEQKPTIGNPPLGISGYASAVINNDLYFFGGECNHDTCHHNSLYSLNIDTLTWRELSATNPHCGPMMKSGCGMVAAQFDGEDYLVVTGGFYCSSANNPPQQHAYGAQYANGRTNELHYYKISTREWISPTVTGNRPPPCEGFSFTAMTNNSAVLFGGFTAADYNDTVYVGEFSKSTVSWKEMPKPPGRSVDWPIGRYNHSSALVSSPSGPHLIVMGGTPAYDCWLLNINKGTWKKLALQLTIIGRHSHSLTVWSVTPSTTWVIQFGGERGDLLSDIALIELTYSDTEWSVETLPLDQYQEKLTKRWREWVELSSSSSKLLLESEKKLQRLGQELKRSQQERRTKEQEQGKLQQELQQQLQKRDQQLQDKDKLLQERNQQFQEKEKQFQDSDQQLQERDKQLQEKNRQLQKRDQQLREKEQEIQEKDKQFRERDQQLQESTKQLYEKDKQIREKDYQLQESNKQLKESRQLLQSKDEQIQRKDWLYQQIQQEVREANKRNQELEEIQVESIKRSQQLQVIQERFQEKGQQLVQQKEYSWVVRREEINMTPEVLGKGGYGEVRVAIFRGLRVAAKCLHEMIISDYNISLFRREMEMAAKIRHPNLLQFIGATQEGTPVILTELMPTSLQKELESGPIPYPSVLSISLDVACALNYLHLFRPSPILHRDVSSPNILLQTNISLGLGNVSIGVGWRAKLSDYGSANLQSKTANPGNPFYSAPESANPTQHSTAMDVYSYGVLLLEMIIRKVPFPDERDANVDAINRPKFKALVQHCLQEDRSQRPTMSDIIKKLNETM